MQLNGRLDWRGRVLLFQHPDFGQAILRAAEHFAARKLRPAVIEKDYYVTEGLRIIPECEGDRAIFKGGTSLSKGWGLIERFSEARELPSPEGVVLDIRHAAFYLALVSRRPRHCR